MLGDVFIFCGYVRKIEWRERPFSWGSFTRSGNCQWFHRRI